MNLQDRILNWLFSDDTGTSSKHLCAHMLGLKHYKFYPHDPGDLGRCLRLLELIPEWKPRLHEMEEYGAGWAGLIKHWDEISALMLEEVGIDWEKGDRAPKTYKAMKDAISFGYKNDSQYDCLFNKDGSLMHATFKGDHKDK